MKEPELKRRIDLYLKRTKEDSLMESHNPNEVGYWEIIGGITQEEGRYKIEEIIYGKFIDVVAFAVQQGRFYSVYLSGEDGKADPSNCNNGEIIKVKACELKDGKLVEILRN